MNKSFINGAVTMATMLGGLVQALDNHWLTAGLFFASTAIGLYRQLSNDSY